MESVPRPEDDPFLGQVVRRFAPEDAGDPADSCPGDNVLASLAGGRLLAGEREGLEAHLSRCERCRPVADVLLDAAPAARETGWIRRPARARVTAAAAVLLAAATLVLGPDLISRARPGGVRAPAGTEEILLASAADLARARPDLFDGFAPLSREERLSRGPRLRAGDLALLYPSGRILEARPEFRWESSSGRADEIVLRTARGDLVWRGTGIAPSLEYPADAPDLAPGARYVWEVSRDGRRIFATASAEERAAFEAGAAEIEARAPRRIRALLLAHLALRGELFGEAERAARAFLAAEPQDEVGRETLAHALRRMGASEADDPVSPAPR